MRTKGNDPAGDNRDKVSLPLLGMDTRLKPEPGTASLIQNMVRDAGEGTWTTMPGVVPITVSFGDPAISLFWFQPRPNERYLITERNNSAVEAVVAWHQFQLPDVTIATRRRIETDMGSGEAYLEHGRWLYFTSPGNAFLRWDGRRTVPVGFDRPAPAVEVFTSGQYVEATSSGKPHDYIDKALGQYTNYNDIASNIQPALTPKTWNVPGQRGVGEVPSDLEYEEATAAGRVNPLKVDWTYVYGLTQFNDLGQMSPMGPIAIVSGTNGYYLGKRMPRVRIPQLPNAQGCALWRSQNVAGATGLEGARMFLVAQWSASHGFDYMDTASDAELGREYDPDEVGPTPVGARAVAFWQGSLWLGGMPSDPSTLVYSDPLYLEQFPAVNRLTIGSSRAGHIVALKPVPRGLIVLKTSGTYIVKGSPIDGYRVEVIDDVRGTTAPRAVEFVPGRGLMFLHTSGPMLLAGTVDDDQPTQLVPAAETLSELWKRRVAGVHISAAVSVYNPEHNEVWFHLPSSGDNRPDFGLVFHTVTGEWSTRENWNISGFHYYKGRVYAVGWNAQKVYRFSAGSRTPSDLSATSTITGTYLLNPVQSPEMFTAHRATVLGRAYGSTATFNLATRADGAGLWTVQTETARPTLHLMRDADEWGTGLWQLTAGVYGSYQVTRLPVSLRVPAARYLEFRISGDRLSIGDLELTLQTREGGPPDLERR